ncbi:MAG: BatD family protein, partial [Alteromonadaceae bacterium]|nr:BatD family protein [Alteromonadaceae bacterium]
MVRIIIWYLGFLLTLPAMALTQVTATVDTNPVMAKESFILEVIADDDINANAFDSSALSKDFIVGQTSVSSQTSSINLTTTRTTRWTTLLIARKPGNYVIPAFTIKNKQTKPITLEVLSPGDTQKNSKKNIFIETALSATEVYVQQQLTLTVKLHFSADLKRGNLSEPAVKNASLSQIGQDKESSTIINGKRYRIYERIYTIKPQKSGELIIKSPIFSGEILKPSARRSNFLSFGETKPVSAIGEDLTISVLPIPESYQGTWLPSELLSLHQEWQPSPDTFKVGEPITRTITLTAAGLSEEQLPEITMTLPHGLKVYPDQTELHTGMNNNRLVSQKVKNF